jgi:hypothetical protein
MTCSARGSEIALWATASERGGGKLVQADRIGNSSFNPFFVEELKNKFNAGNPADDVSDYLLAGSRWAQAK